MFSRFKMVAMFGVLLASFSGASPADEAVSGSEGCSNRVQIEGRQVARPPKAIRLPKRSATEKCARAAKRGKPLVLVSFTEARGGMALERGQFTQAAELLTKRPYTGAEVLTNLCVAQTALRQFDAARASCDAAVTRAIGLSAREPFGKVSRRQADQALAIAYSNRAVLNWLIDDPVAAHQDLSRAHMLTPVASFVTRNLEVTGSVPALARTPDVRVRLV